MKAEIDEVIEAVVSRGVFTPDEQVGALEAEFAGWMRSPYAVGVASGSSALALALRSVGVEAGDEVVITANLDISVVGPITQVGARPRFVDIEAGTQTMDPEALAHSLCRRTGAVVLVHCHGHVAALRKILDEASSRGIPIIEDATLAPGAWYADRRVGSFGTVGCFSFAPTKPLGAFGNAGMVVTSSEEIARRVRTLANYGFREDSIAAIRSGRPGATFRYAEPGINATMDELQAAVVRIKLGRIDEWAGRRRSYAATYRRVLRDSEDRVVLPVERAGGRSAPRFFVVRTPRRDQIAEMLHADGIRTAMNYVPPMHVQPPYGDPGKVGTLPVTERISDELLCLPLAPELEAGEIEYSASRLAHALGAG
ncbi:DegT/DnrJ/EryC1/StrS family aminotransferase [Candidatus Spongiisocius sp.]|uniref:DegT/DnrJ/EryC1/StrS family aminotransferase n=1 Tax=Candidatus Spongiisocius sp. TaxID=3101273 RepID=UPI003B5CCC3D